MRRFEFQEGTSHKFWEVFVESDTVAVHFGKVGTQGQTQSKSFESEDVARRACEKLIAEKLRKGYVEVTPKARPGPAPAAKPAHSQPAPASATRVLMRSASGASELILLHAGKRFGMHEGGKWHVQLFPSASAAKDHFERIQFLRGKEGLKTVETTQVPAEQAEAVLKDGIENFAGKVEVREGRGIITFEGYPDDPVPLSACTGLVKWMARESLRSVQLICDHASPKKNWARALQGVTLPALKSFILDNSYQSQTRQGDNSVGDLAAVLAACPHLEHLYAIGGLDLGAARHESLRELYLLGNPLSPALLEGLGGCEFPRLERLVLSLNSEGRPPSPALLVQALRGLRAPVSEVHIEQLDGIGEALELLGAQGLPPSWRVLSLNGEWGDDDEPEDVRALLQRHAGALGALEALGLPDDLEVWGTPLRTGSAEEYRGRFGTNAYAAW